MSKTEEKDKPQEEPCVLNCDHCSWDKFNKCNQIGKERI